MDDVEVLRALAAELYRLPTATDQQAAAAMDAADLILHMAGSAPIEPSERVSAALSALGGWNAAIDGLGDFLYAIEPIAARPGPYGTTVSISPVEARLLLSALRRPATGEG